MLRFLRVSVLILVTLAMLLATLWVCGAIGYRLPLGGFGRVLGAALAGAAGLALILLLWRWNALRAVAMFVLLLAAVLVWWTSIRPSSTRDWADEVARQLAAHVDGERVTLDNVRNFGWRSLDDYDARWETRRYDLSQLRSVDAVLSYWMGPAIAHTLVSFGFADGRGGVDYLTFSIEIRKERGEDFSALGGFFKQFEATLVAADERDIIRVRTNLRGEDDYLYRVAMPPAAMRSLFLAYLKQAEELRRRPRWYNTATSNCTTVIFKMMRHIVSGLPLDYRLLLSGYLPEYLHEIGGLTPGYSLDELRTAGCITDRAKAAGDDPAFSQRIRAGVPGIADRHPAAR
jgi:hypothetical protein